MAINDTSKPTPAPTVAGSFNMDSSNNVAATPVQQTPVTQAPARTFATLQRSPLGRYSGSEAVKDLENRMGELLKAASLDKALEYKFIPLDNQNNRGLAYGVLVFALVNTEIAPDAVAFHTLILEQTAPSLPPRVITQNGVQVEIMNPPSNAWDPTLAELVKEAVSQAYRNKRLFMVDATVVPRTFNAQVVNDLHALTYNTFIACSTEIDRRTPGFRDVNLAEIQKGNLTVGLTVATKQQSDDTGLPQRVAVEVLYQDNVQAPNQNGNLPYSVNTQERSTEIGRVGGFIDFSWAPAVTGPAYAQMYSPPQLQNGLLPSHKFAPRLVLTAVAPMAASTPPAILNLLAPVTAVLENMNWVQAFLNRGVKSKWNDIGALNIEGNFNGDPSGPPVGQKVDTTGDSFNIEKLYAFVGSLVRPGMAISLDVPDAGPQSWYLSLFAQAAQGSPSAIDAVIGAANTLTAGNFSRNFPQGAAVFIDQGNRIHMGTIEPTLGVIEDLRNVDYLAVANAKGVENPDILRKYTDTFQATDYLTLERRLDERARIIREVAPSAVFTGFATRCTFSPEFITALWQGIKACGVSPTVTTHGMSTGPQVNRASAAFASNGLVMPGTLNAFNQGTTQSLNRQTGGASWTGRW